MTAAGRATAARPALGLWSGIGLVSANMIGAGVFLSAGYMAQQMGPRAILLAWLAGLALALAGARAYAEVAARVPRSGGEYRYLSELLHPWLGYVAGWVSLLVGFAAPAAINALGAAGFLAAVIELPDPRIVATAIVVVLSAVHASGRQASRRTQDALAALKVALVLAFVAVGLALGARALPDWPPRPAGDVTRAFLDSQFYIAFAFSGWNAAVYVADEFRAPARDVGRSMLIGCSAVGALYLVVNFVLVANLTPAEAAVVTEGDATVTLGHVVATRLLGPVGGSAMSLVAAVVFVSAASAMTYVGPRVAAAMARDGYLPRRLAGRDERPPTGSVLFQGAIAIAVVWAQGLHGALQTVGALLTLFAALTCVALFRLAVRPGGRATPTPLGLAAAALYVAVASWLLYHGFRDQLALLVWSAVAIGAATISYLATPRR